MLSQNEKKVKENDWYVEEELKSGKTRKIFLKKILVDYIHQNFKFIIIENDFYLWNEVFYELKSENFVKEIINNYLDESGTEKQVNDTFSGVYRRNNYKFEDVNNYPGILNLKNCMIRYSNDKIEVLAHNSKYLFTTCFNVDYDPAAECPKIEAFMENSLIYPEDKSVILQFFASTLIGNTKAKYFMVFEGPPDCGKSTLLQSFTELLGEDNYTSISLKDITEKQFAAYRLRGKKANICGDISNEFINDSSLFKQILGNDTFHADVKHKDPVQFRNTARFIFSCNQMPQCSDKTAGWYKKLLLIKFKTYRGELDNDLENKLKTEASGFLNLLIQFIIEVINQNYNIITTNSIKEEQQKYKIENNNVLAFFNDCIQFNEWHIESSSKIYDRYKMYCDENGMKNVSMSNFNKMISAEFTNKDIISKQRKINDVNTRTYNGIMLSD